jgi:uncharacterized membrane protein YedE/YeeE
MTEATLSSLPTTVAWAAFVLGIVFGGVAQKSHFCTMGAVADIVNFGDWNRMRMWLLAMAVAILGTQGLAAAGLIDVAKSIYATPRLIWLSHLLGGLLFGFGMVLASGCGSKTVIRIGGGSLKAVVTFLVLAVTAYMTLKGLFAVLRVGSLDSVALTLSGPQDLPALAARLAGAAPAFAHAAFGLAIGLALLAFVFARRDFWRGELILGGVVTGLVIVGGWWVSGHLGYIAEDPNTLQEAFAGTNSGRMESFSYVSPLAYTIELLMLWSDKSTTVTFGVAAVLGTIVGSAIVALATRQFRWEGFRDAEDTANHLVGGALMGFGGVTALGCTIGQGLSGVSTLALGSFLSLAAIIVGAVLALKYQTWRLERMDS